MNELNIADYVDLKKEEETLSSKVKELTEKYITPLKLELDAINNKKEVIKERVLEEMKTENIKTYEYVGLNITRAQRKSLQIVDDEAAIKMLTSPTVLMKIKKITGWKMSEITTKLIERKLTKDAKTVIGNLAEVDGLKIKGSEVQVTEYLIVK